ncbi:MAG: SPASM domain-containing protein, partial [Nanoarchaeota archaeon]|nr:SPASM domain-containing protein [Nanoarchaeota archaeon]
EVELQKAKNIEKISYRSCLQGELVCALSPEGTILPCPIGNFKEFEVGNILTDDITNLWKNDKHFDYFRNVENIDVCNQ